MFHLEYNFGSEMKNVERDSSTDWKGERFGLPRSDAIPQIIGRLLASEDEEENWRAGLEKGFL